MLFKLGYIDSELDSRAVQSCFIIKGDNTRVAI